MLIGFTDDSLAGIIANILADVANVWLLLMSFEILYQHYIILIFNFYIIINKR